MILNQYYNSIKDLIQLKKSDEIYTYGQFNLVDEDNPNLFAYTRTLNNKKILVVGNLTDQVSNSMSLISLKMNSKSCFTTIVAML